MKRVPPILAAIIACTVFSCANDTFVAQEVERPDLPESATRNIWIPDERDSINGYPPRKRRIGGPTDVEWDLDNSFPKSGSLLELMLRGREFESQ